MITREEAISAVLAQVEDFEPAERILILDEAMKATAKFLPKTKRMPRGFRKGHDGSIACPHRDKSCCNDCAKAHEEIVDIVGAHFWIANPVDRAAMKAEMEKTS